VKEFRNKIAVITGSANGIGKAFALEGAKRGMRLALIDIDEERLPGVKAECEQFGSPGVAAILADVSSPREVRDSIAQVTQAFGGVDVMFSNAGIATAGWINDLPSQDWQWAMDVNSNAMAYYAHEVLPIMEEQKTPAYFMFTASIAGLIGGLRINTSYLASKHAALCIAEGTRDYVKAKALDIGISVFCPEYIRTDIHNSERRRPTRYTVADDPFYQSKNHLDYKKLFEANITQKGMNPDFVGPRLFRAMEDEQMYIAPHLHTHESVKARHRAIEADLEKDRALHMEFASLQ